MNQKAAATGQKHSKRANKLRIVVFPYEYEYIEAIQLYFCNNFQYT